MNNKIKQLLLPLSKPQGVLLRHFSSAYLLFSSITMALVYYSINYEICTGNKCNNLKINSNWESLTPFLLILSSSIFLTSIFVYKNKELPRIYSAAIALGFGAATILSGKLVVLMLREININI
ncbi:MAG: hypothetical protein ABW157_14030 [Candidatus Thiodiazotropha sp. LLP2]